MNKKEFKVLSAYYAAAKSLKDQIDNCERLVNALKYRGEHGTTNYCIGISDKDRHGDYVSVIIPSYIVRDAIMPALVDALRKMKDDYKALPPVRCKDRS